MNWQTFFGRQILEVVQDQMSQINIAGKVMRARAKSGFRKSGICVVSAWLAEHQLVLGQEKVATKSNQKTAISELLAALDLQDGVVSCDAAGGQLKNADLIVQKQGHYLVALKKDHQHIYEQGSEWMKQNKAFLPQDEWVDFGSGRIEKRVCYVENHLKLLDDLKEWQHLKSNHYTL